MDKNRSVTVTELCPETGLYVGYVPELPGVHSQGRTLDEVHRNPIEAIKMLLEDEDGQAVAQ